MAFVAVIVLGVVVALAATRSDEQSPATTVPVPTTEAATTTTLDPQAAVIVSMVEAYNAGDIDALVELFSDESVIENHPFSPRTVGPAPIRVLMTQDRDSAASQDPYTIENLQVEGNVVTWDHRWTREDFEVFCKRGQSATIENGKIITWTWSVGSFDCV